MRSGTGKLLKIRTPVSCPRRPFEPTQSALPYLARSGGSAPVRKCRESDPNGGADGVVGQAQTNPAVLEPPPRSLPALLTALDGEDDENTDFLDLGFDFPFPGGTYSKISVGTNGGVILGPIEGYSPYVGYSPWSDFEEFSNVGAPLISPFQTDLDLSGDRGRILLHKEDGLTVVTWD